MSALPASMMCVEIKTPGGPEALVPTTRPVPQPKAGELLIKVAATAVNRPDIAQRAGLYPPPPGASDLPGLEAAGSVAALGEGVSGWEIGDPVCALTPGGSYAEYCTVPAPQCLPLPAGFDMLHAAALPENYFTVWHNLFERGQLKAGESVLIHGGASGIGTTAIQLAKAFGATVIATAGSPGKCDACLRLGADVAVNYRSQDFVAAVKEATGGRGADVIYDPVGGAAYTQSTKVVAFEGRIVVVGFASGSIPSPALNHALVKNYAILGLHWGLYNTKNPKLVLHCHEQLTELAARGAIKPLVSERVPLSGAAAAVQRVADGVTTGRVAVVPSLENGAAA
jgi:NADPH2:quinone reductase